MNKFFKILIISVGVLIGVLLLGAVLVPVLFKDKLTVIVKNIANDNLNATVDFSDLKLSVFKEFPDITISMRNFSIVGKKVFEGDTLAKVESLNATINVMSYIKNDNIDLKIIEVNRPYVHAIASTQGVNWDVMLASTDTIKTPEVKDESGGFNMDLKKFVINDGVVIYEDKELDMITGLGSLNVNLKGNMKESNTVLDLNADCGSFNIMSGGKSLLSEAKVTLNSKIDADLNNMIFSFKDTDCEINSIALLLNGSVQMKENNDIPIDITYQAKAPSIKMLVDMIPKSMLSDFKGLQTKGSLDLKGWVKGIYNEKSMPQVWCEFKADNGYIKYADLPKAVENINIDAKILIDMNDDKKSHINVSKFHVEMANNPIDATLNVKTPMTDADIDASVTGRINFTSLKESLPINTDIKGLMDANIKFAGRMSAVEKKQFDRIKLTGNIKMNDFMFKTEELKVPFEVSEANLNFTPENVNLSSFIAKLGSSDLNVNGKIDNILSFVLKNETLKGTVNIKSKLINCNEIMPEAESAKTEADATTEGSMGIIEIPKNLDLRCNLAVDKIIYDNLELKNATGAVVLNQGALVFDKFGANFADGSISLNGSYKAESAKQAKVDMNLGIKDMNVKSIATSFNTVEKVVPLIKNLDGKMNLDFDFNTKMKADMSPDLMTMNAKGRVRADSLQIMDSENLNKITSLLGLKQKSNKLKNINVAFALVDGKIAINPFATKLGNINMAAGGAYGLDESLDAQVDFRIPAEGLANAAGSLTQLGAIGNLLSNSSVNIGVAITGTTGSPTFKLAKTKYTDIIGKDTNSETTTEAPVKELPKLPTKEEVSEKVKEEVDKKIEEVKEDAKAKAKEKLKDLFKKK